jgi:hypothetical protein
MPLVHFVALRFRAGLTDDQVARHLEEDVALRRRMPELVEWWLYRRNASLADRPEANLGCQWVVVSKLFREADLPAYLAHPQHREVAAIQAPLLEAKFVADWVVGEGELAMMTAGGGGGGGGPNRGAAVTDGGSKGGPVTQPCTANCAAPGERP